MREEVHSPIGGTLSSLPPLPRNMHLVKATSLAGERGQDTPSWRMHPARGGRLFPSRSSRSHPAPNSATLAVNPWM